MKQISLKRFFFAFTIIALGIGAICSRLRSDYWSIYGTPTTISVATFVVGGAVIGLGISTLLNSRAFFLATVIGAVLGGLVCGWAETYYLPMP